MMKKLADFLTRNPVIIILMFVFTLISSLAGFVLSWKSFYADYLSISISMPIWVPILFMLFAFFGWVIYGSRSKVFTAEDLVTVTGKEFGVERVNIAAKNFVRCRFSGSELIFDGHGPVGFEHCNFTQQRFTFEGPAGNTIELLTNMYKDPSFRPLVDGIFENIRKGLHPQAVRPSQSGLDK